MRGVTSDSNIFISALVFGGECAHLIRMVRAGEFRLALSEEIIREVIAVLREDFHWTPYRLQDARQRMMSIAVVLEPKERLSVVAEDPDDDRVLECAVEAGSEAIVTRDKDLLRLGSFEGIRILTPSQLLAEVRRA